MREFGGGGATWVGAAAPTYANHRRFLGLRDPSDRGISQGAFLSGAGGRMRVWVRACARVCARLWQYLLLRPRLGRGNARIFAAVFSHCCAFSRGRFSRGRAVGCGSGCVRVRVCARGCGSTCSYARARVGEMLAFLR